MGINGDLMGSWYIFGESTGQDMENEMKTGIILGLGVPKTRGIFKGVYAG